MRSRILPALLLALLLLQACCRRPTQFYTIPASAYSYIPYDSTSSFRLQDTLGHVNNFVFEQIKRDDQVDITCFECCGSAFDQQYEIIFRGDNPAVAMSIGLLRGLGGEIIYDTHVMTWAMSPSDAFIIPLNDPNCPNDPTVQCLDSLAVGGQVYHDVLEFGNRSYVSSADSITAKLVWYSKTVGLLKMQMMNGKTWELMP
jgi:hypothetical protein